MSFKNQSPNGPQWMADPERAGQPEFQSSINSRRRLQHIVYTVVPELQRQIVQQNKLIEAMEKRITALEQDLEMPHPPN